MKKLLLLIIPVLMLTGCYAKYEAVKNAYILDYTEFTSKGFFITESNSVNFEYDALGSAAGVSYDGYEVIYKKDQMSDDTYTRLTDIKVKYGKFIASKPIDALRELCIKVIEEGGNGVINVKIESTSRNIPGTSNSTYGYIATGMAIRKK